MAHKQFPELSIAFNVRRESAKISGCRIRDKKIENAEEKKSISNQKSPRIYFATNKPRKIKKIRGELRMILKPQKFNGASRKNFVRRPKPDDTFNVHLSVKWA